jgi:DNA-binding transcriptional LysR family regulator
MDKFQEIRAFATVVDQGSFVNGADALGMSKAAVSRHVGELESRLGIRLLHRTTRRLSLTEEGQIFYSRCKQLLAGLEEAEGEISSRHVSASGLIRVNAPVTFGISHLAPLWGEFMALHPAVRFEITLLDRIVDIVEEGYDLAIRIATLSSSTLVSRQLSSARLVLCASPQYLLQKGTPHHPDELAAHTTIAYSYLSTKDEWQFEGPQGKISIQTSPCMHTNSGETCRAAALAHQGVILQPNFLVGEDLRAGRLVELMPAYRGREFGIHAIYPSRKHVPAKVRVLIDFLAQRLAEPGASW